MPIAKYDPKINNVCVGMYFLANWRAKYGYKEGIKLRRMRNKAWKQDEKYIRKYGN